MKKIFSGVLIFTGVIFLIFIVNIVLYSSLPGYRAALSKAVGQGTEVVREAGVDISAEDIVSGDANVFATAGDSTDMYKEQADNGKEEIYTNKEDNPGAGPEPGSGAKTFKEPDTVENSVAKQEEETTPDGKQPVIIDKEYHEDCGTGKGYWVITYSDGSTSIE